MKRILKKQSVLDAGALQQAFEAAGINERHIKSAQRFTLKNYSLESQQLDYAKVKDLPKKALDLLYHEFMPITSKVIERQDSSDGSTTKLLIQLQDGHKIETVIMRYGEVELRSFPERERLKMQHIVDDVENEDKNSSDSKSLVSTTTTGRRFKSQQRATVCVSSQVGCAMGCTFCATGAMGLMANLSAGEILEQIVHANLNYGGGVKGVVFMGLGEPLDNYEAVKMAVDALCDVQLFSLSPSRITVSTVGVVGKIRRMIDDMPMVGFALSLHAGTQELRQKIVPTAKSWQIERILDASMDFIYNQNLACGDRAHAINDVRRVRQQDRLRKRIGRGLLSGVSSQVDNNDDGCSVSNMSMISSSAIKHNRRKILLEYVLLGPDVNCSAENAHELGRILTAKDKDQPLPELYVRNNAALNLIPYNPTIAGVAHQYEPPSQNTVDFFLKIVRSYGIQATVRQEMGQDIDAACGQLVIKNVEAFSGSPPAALPSKDTSTDIEEMGLVRRLAKPRRKFKDHKISGIENQTVQKTKKTGFGKDSKTLGMVVVLFGLLVARIALLLMRSNE